MKVVDAEPSTSLPVTMIQSGPTNDLSHRSQTEGTQGALDSGSAHIDHIQFLFLKQVQLATPLNYVIRRFNELEEERHVLLAEKKNPSANIYLQAAESKKLKAQKGQSGKQNV